MKKLHELKPVQRWAFNILKRAKILPHISAGIGAGYGAPRQEYLEAYSRAYAVVAPVFVGVNAIASAAASVPLRWYQIPKGKEEEDKELLPYNHPLPSLFRFVNYFDTGYDIQERMYASLLLTGNFAFLQEPPDVPQPKELWPLRGDRLVVVPGQSEDPKQFILRYDYMNDMGRALPLDPKNVLHLKFFNPYDSFYGQGFVSAARNAIAFDLDAMRFNIGIMKSPTPDVVLKDVSADKLQPEQAEIDRIKEAWNKAFGGVGKVGERVAVVGNLEPQIMKGLTPREVEWILGRRDARQEMYQVLGIPPVMANTPEERYATALVQKRIFWENAIIPKHTKVAAVFTQWAQTRWGENILCAYDYSNVAALQEDQEMKARIWQIGFSCSAVSPDDMRQKVYGLEPRGGVADMLWVSPMLIPMEGSEPKAPRADGDGKAIRSRLIESEQRDLLWRKFLVEVAPFERKLQKIMRAYYTELEKKVLAIPLRGIRDPWDLIEDGLDDTKELAALNALLRLHAGDVLDAKGNKALAALGLTADFDVTNPKVVEWIEKKAFKFSTQVWGTTKDLLEKTVKELVADPSLTLEEMTKAIQAGLGHDFDVLRHNAMRVARTETISAANAGQQMAWEESGVVERREWLTARDEKVRESHSAMDGEVAEMGQPYSNGMMFPGDPTAEPEESINCRCTETAIISEKARLEIFSRRIEKRLYPGRAGSRRLEAQNYELVLARIESAVNGDGKEGKL